MRKICVAVLLVPALAWAQPKKTAGEWYKEGENQYILGNFEKAVEAFKNGFTLETDEDKRAKYVFNIAQSYRQANDCAKAHFFYKRFLALKASPKAAPLDPQSRQQVEDRIKDLEACAQQAALISKRPPDSLPGDADSDPKPPPSGGDVRKAAHDEARTEVATPGNTAPGPDEDERADTGEPAPTGARPRLISARFTGGGTKFRMGPMVKVPVQAAFALTAGYPIAIDDRLTVDAGAVFTLTPVPYSVRQPMSTDETSKTALLTGVMANGAVSYEAAPRLSVRADLGLGALLFSNVSMSRFTAGRPTSGALTMFHLRAAPSADYAFTPNILGTVTVAFTYSPAKDGLEETIKSITSFDFMLGIGYRM